MYTIALVNMPFAQLALPSIALTQLKSVTEARFPGQVRVEVIYLTHEFAAFIGLDRYQHISHSMQALYAGLGDWFFRAVAFPELPDNVDGYLRRYYSGREPEVATVRDLVATKRVALEAYLDELITRHGLDRADVVGFTSMFMQNAACFAMANAVKRRNPAAVTIMGGANCESPMGQVIARNVDAIDYVFSGPALKSFPEFVEGLLRGDAEACRSIGGVFARAGTPEPHAMLGAELDIDTPVDLDYADFMRQFEASFAGSGIKPRLLIETSRGCWWGERAHCTFCGLNGATMAYRAMTPELALRQFRSLFPYGGRVKTIDSVDNILPTSYLQDVFPRLDTPPNMEIFYEVKADLTRADMQILADARVLLIQPGIEALATSTLKLMKKGTTALQNVTFLRNCQATGLKPIWNLLIGFPGERAEVYKRYLEVMPLLTHLTPPSGVFPIRFDRFSPYHKQAQGYGLDLRPMELYSWIYPFGETDLEDFAYYFSDRNVRAEYFKDLTDWIQPLQAAVGRWQARWAGTNHTPPRLAFRDPHSDVIDDSRGESPAEHAVGEVGRALLQEMAGAVRLEQVTKTCTTGDAVDVSRALDMLLERRLVFQEGDRVVSLVLGGVDTAAHHPVRRSFALASAGAERVRNAAC